jgi:hypothetical protein
MANNLYAGGGFYCATMHHPVSKDEAVFDGEGRACCPIHGKQLRTKPTAQSRRMQEKSKLKKLLGDVMQVCTEKTLREGSFWVCHTCGYKEFA